MAPGGETTRLEGRDRQQTEEEVLGGRGRQSQESWGGQSVPFGSTAQGGLPTSLLCCSEQRLDESISRADAFPQGEGRGRSPEAGVCSRTSRRMRLRDIRGAARAHVCVTFPYKSQINSRMNECAAQPRGFGTSKEAKRHRCRW